MGKSILTARQLEFLEFVNKQKSVTENFYFTGGTALSEFYLHHRLSEDLDFFSLEEVKQITVEAFLKKFSQKILLKEIKKKQFLGLFSYTLAYRDNEKLKVDFNYYPFPLIDKGLKFKNIIINSLYDIAVDKVHTLFMKPRTRDYIDLYFIMKKENYLLPRLILDAKAKFDWDIDKVNLGSQFSRVRDLKNEDFPKMVVPFERHDMESFFLKLAGSLKDQILE